MKDYVGIFHVFVERCDTPRCIGFNRPKYSAFYGISHLFRSRDAKNLLKTMCQTCRRYLRANINGTDENVKRAESYTCTPFEFNPSTYLVYYTIAGAFQWKGNKPKFSADNFTRLIFPFPILVAFPFMRLYDLLLMIYSEGDGRENASAFWATLATPTITN